jgi:uncharacterized protein
VVSDGPAPLDQPRVYFGPVISNTSADYAIVGRNGNDREYDYETSNETKNYTYTGLGGVPVGSWISRSVFAAKFAERNFLFSNVIGSNSKILFNRDPARRVEAVAPWLTTESGVYPAIVNKRLVWIIDGYTTLDNYPYSELTSLESATADSTEVASNRLAPDKQVSYIRNSVKATVDAYDGTVTLYVTDPTDPIVRAWQSAFPALFKPASAMPAELPAHLRFPEDLFRVQSDQWGRYHLSDPQSFYQAGDAWSPAQDPGVGSNAVTSTTLAPVILPNGKVGFPTGVKEQDPFYMITKLPQDSQQTFLLEQPMVALSTSSNTQQNLTAIMVAKGDPGDYGQLEVLTMPSGERIAAPAQINSLMQQDPNVSRDLSLFNQGGSEVLLGNVLTVPVNQSLLYVRPLYISSKSSSQPLPQLKKVIVVYNNSVYYENTLQEALQDAFPGLSQLTQEQNVGQGSTTPTTTPGTTPTTPGSTTTTTPGSTSTTVPSGPVTVVSLLQQAQAEFAAANNALAKTPPDFASYALHTQNAQALIKQALQLAQSQGVTVPSTSIPTASSTTVPATTVPATTVP